MNVLAKIERLRNERGWTNYRLAKEAGLQQSTIFSMFKKNNTPTIPTLEAICDAFGLTLSEFFADGNVPTDLTEDQKLMLQNWNMLSDKQQKILFDLIKNMK